MLTMPAHHVGMPKDRQGRPGVLPQELSGYKARAGLPEADLSTIMLTCSLCPCVPATLGNCVHRGGHALIDISQDHHIILV